MLSSDVRAWPHSSVQGFPCCLHFSSGTLVNPQPWLIGETSAHIHAHEIAGSALTLDWLRALIYIRRYGTRLPTGTPRRSIRRYVRQRSAFLQATAGATSSLRTVTTPPSSPRSLTTAPCRRSSYVMAGRGSTGPSVVQVPEPVSPRYRNRAGKCRAATGTTVSSTNRAFARKNRQR